MNTIIRYCKLSHPDPTISAPEATVSFNLKALHPFDAVKVVLEQYLYSYHILTLDRGDNSMVFADCVEEMFSYLKPHTPHDLVNSVLGEYYQACYSLILHMRNHHISGTSISLPLSDLNYVIEAFKTEEMVAYRDREYTATINQDFLKTLLYLYFNFVQIDNGELPVIMPATVYVPELKTVQHYHPDTASTLNKDTSMIYVLTPLTQAVSCHFDLPKDKLLDSNYGPYRYLAMFHYGDLAIDDMMMILSQYTTGQNQYNIDGCCGLIPYMCKAIVTRSGDTPDAGNEGVNVASDAHTFASFIQYLVQDTRRLRTLKDYPLFGMLLATGCLDGTQYGGNSITAYFSKDNPSTISAHEAMSFRTSMWSEFMNDRIMYTTEAADDEPSEDDELSTADTPEGDMEEVSPIGDADVEDESSKNDKPQIDPSLMLLEIASRYDTMSQHLFRTTVSARMKAIIDNPPPSLSSSTITMMKRWRSRWLYLVTIPVLRDFVTRIGVRLSDTRN